jgi:(p)ppGpp synthase/HD superfamily hydrolase
MSLIKKAHALATAMHAGVVRMGSGEPYVEHVERVAASLAELGFPEHVIAAAYLHDVIEDTGYSEAELAKEFSPEIAALVAEVTNPVLPKEPGNRAWRKAKEVEHLAKASYFGASIKLADMLDNSSNVREVNPEFAATYLPVLAAKLAVLGHGHPELFAKVKANLAK